MIKEIDMRKIRIFLLILSVLLLFYTVSYGEDAKVYYKLGYTYYTQKNFKDAVEAYKKSLELDPKNVDALYWMGKCYFEMKQYRKAMDAWISTLKMKESHKGAFSKLISYYYYLIPQDFNSPEGYLNYARKLLKVNEENFIGKGLSVDTLLTGFAVLKKYLRSSPSSIVGNFIIAQVYEKLSYNFSYQFYGYTISAYKKVIDYEEQNNKDAFVHPLEYWFSYRRLIKIYKIIDRGDLAEKFKKKMEEAISAPYNRIFEKNNLTPLGVPDRIEVVYANGEREEIWYYREKDVSFIYKNGVLEEREERP